MGIIKNRSDGLLIRKGLMTSGWPFENRVLELTGDALAGQTVLSAIEAVGAECPSETVSEIYLTRWTTNRG